MTEKAPAGLFPEECLAELSKRVLQDLKALMLMNGAIQTHRDLFHPEMLLKCLRESDADLNVVGALLTKTQDRRFLKVIEFCRSSRQKTPEPPKTLSLAARIRQTTFDREFGLFGIKISQLNSLDEKKFSSPNRLLRGNIFFRNRALFGCNWRADIVSCIEMGLKNPSEIKKRLHCSYETAHRVFNDYMLFQNATSGRPSPRREVTQR